MVRVETGPAVIEEAGRTRVVEVRAFEIDRTEVTVEAYRACARAKACRPPNIYDPAARETHRHCVFSSAPGRERHPVNCVSYDDATTFCAFRQKRLPSRLEWLRAARGSSTSLYVWGNDFPPPAGAGNFADETAADTLPFWVVIEGYVDGFPETAPVHAMSGDRSAFGVIGLAGNLREWVSSATPGAFRTVNGASFGEASPTALRVDRRSLYAGPVRSAHIGFRCARTP